MEPDEKRHRRSALRFALLALLADGAATGYDLAKSMAEPVAHFWHAERSQIHPELRRMAAEGLIEFTEEAGPGPHGRKVYRMAPPGRSALVDWVAEPVQERFEKDEFCLKVYASWLADAASVRSLIEAERAEFTERLNRHEATLPDLEQAADDPRRFASLATLRMGIGYARHRIAWCDWMLDQLDAR